MIVIVISTQNNSVIKKKKATIIPLLSSFLQTDGFGYLEHPIATSLHTLMAPDDQDAIAVFKLILKFLSTPDPRTDPVKKAQDFIMGNYIVQKVKY